tara:strand:- start:775 stop:1266 length:492 start_codon:yes stop_codon:yes gene_type:complete
MVVKDGQKWRRVNSQKIRGHWYGFRDAPEGEELDNTPNIFITIDERVPKNMSGEGADIFELWPIKHYGNVRYSSWRYYHRYENSYGYYYSVKEYTYWDGVLHSRTQYYGNDNQIKYLEIRMKDMCELVHNRNSPSGDSYYSPPFFVADDERFVNARYSIKRRS